MQAKASSDSSRPAAGKAKVLPVKKRPPRRRKEALVSVDEFVQDVHRLYQREFLLFCPSVAWLARESGVPYETLRHFLTDSQHMLCPVNEEKVARAMGRNTGYFYRVVERWHRFRARKQQALAARSIQQRLGWVWLPLLDLGENVGWNFFSPLCLSVA